MSEAPAGRTVPKPVPEREAQDARGYQIEQLRRRYSPEETSLSDGTSSLQFRLAPSDPDFPYDLDHLQLDLRVPAAYPAESPQLLVRNSNIPRGFAINIERGWSRLVEEKRGATLLALTHALDRRLESFLSEQKADTVKLTIFKDTRHLDAGSAPAPAAAPKPPPARKPHIRWESFPASRSPRQKQGGPRRRGSSRLA